MDLHVLTVATRDNFPLRCWYWSLLYNIKDFNSDHVHKLGRNEKWKGFAWRTQTYLKKLQQLKNNLIRTKQTKTFCILSDAEDVFFLDNPHTILQTYLKHFNPNQAVFCHESMQCVGQFTQPANRKMLYDILNIRYKNNNGYPPLWLALNAGLCIGQIDVLIELLQLNQNNEDDQEGMQLIALSHPTKVAVDTQAQLFGIIRSTYNPVRIMQIKSNKNISFPKNWKFDPQTKKLIYVPTQQQPHVLHFAGKIPVYYVAYLRVAGYHYLVHGFQIRWKDFLKDQAFYARNSVKTYWYVFVYVGIIFDFIECFYIHRNQIYQE